MKKFIKIKFISFFNRFSLPLNEYLCHVNKGNKNNWHSKNKSCKKS